MKYILTTCILSLSFTSAFSALWQVGPTRTYTMPSQVSTLVQNGDTVEIDPGVYFQDVCGWYADNLVLRGTGSYAHLQANFTGYQGKAIWVIGGNNVKVEWIEFSECAVPSQNGAGIRQEGMDLTVLNCYFHNNENGILAGTVANSTITIRNCHFSQNGFGDGLTHNLYINNIDTLIFEYSYSHHAIVGHELKSRAKVNIIRYNRFSNEATGNASREVDIPNGGLCILIGNIVHQGPNGTNGNMVGYGLEGLTNPGPHELYAVHNTMVNERATGSFFQFNSAAPYFKGYNNLLCGNGNYVSGNFPALTDTASNWRVTNINAPLFVNSSAYNYQIPVNSPAADLATPAGTVYSILLDPDKQYSHPAAWNPRTMINSVSDIGAYEAPNTVYAGQPVLNDFIPFPNPASAYVFFGAFAKEASILDMNGRLVWTGRDTEKARIADLENGVYLLKLTQGNQWRIFKLVINQK